MKKILTIVVLSILLSSCWGRMIPKHKVGDVVYNKADSDRIIIREVIPFYSTVFYRTSDSSLIEESYLY